MKAVSDQRAFVSGKVLTTAVYLPGKLVIYVELDVKGFSCLRVHSGI